MMRPNFPKSGKIIALTGCVLSALGLFLLSSCGRAERPLLRIRLVYVSPSQVPFEGGTVTITASVLGGPIRSATAIVSPWGAQLTLIQTSPGIFSTSYHVPANTRVEPVTCTVTVTVEDVYGNRASREAQFTLLGPEVPPPPPL